MYFFYFSWFFAKKYIIAADKINISFWLPWLPLLPFSHFLRSLFIYFQKKEYKYIYIYKYLYIPKKSFLFPLSTNLNKVH